jgi:hypothetical protein
MFCINVVFDLSSSQILSFNADNTSPNDKQTDTMAMLPNSFEKENRVHCFNHMLQLSAKALISPFNAGMKNVPGDELMDAHTGCTPDANDVDNVDGKVSDLEDEDNEGDDDADAGTDADEMDEATDDDINELDQLDEEERNQILEDTNVVRATVSKLCNLSFVIINSTTLALPV